MAKNLGDLVSKLTSKERVPRTVDTSERVLYDGGIPDSEQVMATATATRTTEALPVGQFIKYAEQAKLPAKERQSGAILLTKLAQVADVKLAKTLCADAIAAMSERYEKATTRTQYGSRYRKMFEIAAPEMGIEGVLYDVCRDALKASSKDADKVRSRNNERIRENRANLTPFDPESVSERIDEGLASDDWREITAALIMATHARPVDILKLGEFKLMSKYQVEFTSRAKKRGGASVGIIYTLSPASDVVDAFHKLRRMPEVQRYQGMSEMDVDSSANSTVNLAISRLFGEFIPVPEGDKGDTSAKNLRAAGTNIAHWLYGSHRVDPGELATRQLMHDNPNSEANYKDYCLETSDGQPVTAVGVRKDGLGETVPYYFYELGEDGKVRRNDDGSIKAGAVNDPSSVLKVAKTGRVRSTVKTVATVQAVSETTSSIEADKQLLDIIRDADEWGEGTNGDRLEVIIATARRAKKLAAKVKELEAKMSATEATEKPATTVKSDDVRSLSNADLVGRKRGYAEERIRRTVAAIQDWNAGKELGEQIEINVGSLRKLAGASAVAVGDWVARHQEELRVYAEGQGHPFTSQSKFNRGKNLAVIDLPWN